MNRRSFLGSMLALGAAPAIVRAESLMRIVVPTIQEVAAITRLNVTYGWASANELLTPMLVAREALVILERQLKFSRAVSLGYEACQPGTIAIRRPNRYS